MKRIVTFGLLLVSFSVIQGFPAPRENFKVWRNGGGLVHEKASVQPSAYIDKNSRVDYCAMIESEAILISARLICNSTGDKLVVYRGARMEKSTATGVLYLFPNSQLIDSTGKGELRIQYKGSAKNLSYDGYVEMQTNAAIEGVKVRGMAFIQREAKIEKSEILGGMSEPETVFVDDSAMVKNSKILAGASIGQRAQVENSEVKEKMKVAASARLIDNKLIENK